MEGWRLRAARTVFRTPWLSVQKKEYELPHGGGREQHYVVERGDFTVAVATAGEYLTLVRHYRPAHDRFHWELPGGGLEPGETPEAGAARELLEETGLTAATARQVGVLHALPGYIRSTGYIVSCELGPETPVLLDRREVAEVVQMTWDEAVRMILAGEIDEMQTVSAILLAREALAQRRAGSRPLAASA